MESNFLTAIFLPLALFIIMLGMGLSLTLDDFKRVFVEPKAVIIGLIAQLVMLPIIGYFLALAFQLAPELAVGVMILATCPGGSTSNMITYLIKGNVALSITLTAITSLVTIFTIPLLINLSMTKFMGEGVTLQLPVGKTILQIAVITLIPISLGMLIHYYSPKLATVCDKGVKWLSLFFLGIIIFGLLLKEKENVSNFFVQVGGNFDFNILTMILGYTLATISNLDQSSRKSITVEVGIQNGTLAIAIATTLLNMPNMAIPAAIYSLIMFVTSAVFGWLLGQNPILDYKKFPKN